MAVTESFETWPREGWSSWLNQVNEPIVPADHNITQINLIERVTVTRPGEYGESVEETHQERGHSASSEERRKRRRRHRRSSSEDKGRYDRHTTGRLREFDPAVERRESRRRSQEMTTTTHTSSAHSDGIGAADGRHKRRHRSTSGDRNKPLPPLPPNGDRHTTGRISGRQQTSSEEWQSRSLSGGERRKHRRSGGHDEAKRTSTVGTSMHGQIFLQDGTPAPDFTKSSKSDTLDMNGNGMIRSGQGTLSAASTHTSHNGDILKEEKRPLDSRRSSEDSDIFFNSSTTCCCATPSSLIYAVAVTLVCCWCFPIGIYAVHRALQVQPRRKAGDMAGAMKASKSAGFWATVALIWGALVMGTVLLLVILFANI